MLNELETLPEGLLEAEVAELEALLGGPTLIHLQGRRSEPLFVTVLAHGNEDTGFYAVQALLRDYRERELPRSLSLLIGNVAAARQGLRRLDDQLDYNRIWPGTEHADAPEVRMMRRVVDTMRERQVFASIDVHNNSGINPHYACMNRIDNQFLHLASLFSRTVVYFIRPLGVQSMAMSHLCPAVTIECGKSSHQYGVEHARDYIEACLKQNELSQEPVPSHDVDLYHTVATVKIPDHVSFGFSDDSADLRLIDGIDHLNFRELPAGTQLGWLQGGHSLQLDVRDENGKPVQDRYFAINKSALVTTRPFMPSMFTLDERIIRQDCLGYLMERLLPESV
ncbi:MAG: M14 family metallopeptidase [Gammaproteobacteria bacterium]|nr:M14 family metallopeptidase [Gammaproteobacteria bacterium]MDH3560476.1 M14 family metallopeptidase [Gammaproteobacteria bacterium]